MDKLNFFSQVELIDEELDSWFISLPFDAYYDILGNTFLSQYDNTLYPITPQELAVAEWTLLDIREKAKHYEELFDKYRNITQGII